jgi:hypothetical protein
MFVIEQRILVIALMVSFNHCDPFIPWSSISMDFIRGLPPFNSYDSILVVVVDHSMKMVHFIPCTKIIINKGIAKLFFDHVFWYHGLLKDIISDHKLQFASTF